MTWISLPPSQFTPLRDALHERLALVGEWDGRALPVVDGFFYTFRGRHAGRRVLFNVKTPECGTGKALAKEVEEAMRLHDTWLCDDA